MDIKLQTKAPITPEPIHNVRPGAQAFLGQELAYWRDLFLAQPAAEQMALESQGRALAQAVQAQAAWAQFDLPARVFVRHPEAASGPGFHLAIPDGQRNQQTGRTDDQTAPTSLELALRRLLDQLEAGENGRSPGAHPAIALAAGLVRFCTARCLVHELLPEGRDLLYASEPGETVPSIPLERQSAGQAVQTSSSRVSPAEPGEAAHWFFPPAAQLFYLAQWVAFDELGRLLADSLPEAETRVVEMQTYLGRLNTAAALAPYIAADPAFQHRRYGILGQLINQGRALANYQTDLAIARLMANNITDTGCHHLEIEMHYFDDQALEIHTYRMQLNLAEAGNLASAALACQREAGQAIQESKLHPSTRKQLLRQFDMLQLALGGRTKSRNKIYG